MFLLFISSIFPYSIYYYSLIVFILAPSKRSEVDQSSTVEQEYREEVEVREEDKRAEGHATRSNCPNQAVVRIQVPETVSIIVTFITSFSYFFLFLLHFF